MQGLISKQEINVAIFASGSGTNADNLMHYFKNHPFVKIRLLLCNKAGAPVMEKAAAHGVPVQLVGRQQWQDEAFISGLLESCEVDLIILAGFLWLIPSYLVHKYNGRIINIHPALLPKYGGKGMYGMKVHESVKEKGEMETGITIHFVNELYDEGEVIFQFMCPIDSANLSAEQIAQCVHDLEYKWLPRVVEVEAQKLLQAAGEPQKN